MLNFEHIPLKDKNRTKMKTTILTFIFLLVRVLFIYGQSYPAVQEDLSTRQVHLDFHTSKSIENVGADFNKDAWQKTLKDANINSINIFGKGHHGYSYYPTKVGTVHPNLNFDLLGAQIEACHEIGVKCPIYFTIGWSLLNAEQHPDWVIKDKEGESSASKRISNLKADDPFPKFAWELLMPDGDYLEMILVQIEELCKKYDVDGFWFDIIPINMLNYNENSRMQMKEAGVNIENKVEVEEFHIKKIKHFLKSTNEIVKKYEPEASVFYNWSTHLGESNTFKYRLYEYNTSFDLEDLPTTWDGYNVFPMRAKFFLNEDLPITGMSGKFHTSWGEFGGFKYPNALKYEAASMISFGANVNFGDQLHPNGVLDTETYRNLKTAFNYVEKIEKYGPGGKQVGNVGLWMAFDNNTEQATSLLLLDTHTNYVVANNLKDWSGLELIVVPSTPCINDEDKNRFDEFIENGGKVLLLGEGALNADKKTFVFNIGAEYLGKANYDIDYTRITDKLASNLVTSPFLNYKPAYRVKLDESTEVLANIREPYFSRTKAHYTSHQNTPYQLKNADHPAVFRKGNIVVATHPLDKLYRDNGAQIHRELFNNIVNLLLVRPMVTADIPSCGRLNLLHFPDKNSYVVHLLYGSPIQRGEAQVIDDLPYILNSKVTLDVDENIKNVYLVPSKKKLNFEKRGSKVELIIPEYSCHVAVVFEY